MRMITLLLSILFLFAPIASGEKITLALNWVPEPEFGGIYAAQQSGAFKRNGLDVEIKPGGAGTPTWQLVATGKTDYAVASADEVVIAQSQGADIVAIFATYQICPQGIMVHESRGLKSLEDLFKQGGKLAVEPGLPYVNFLRRKYGFAKLKLVSYDGGIGNFLNDEDFAQQCFITSEPIAAKKAGGDPKVFLVADAGYNPYTAVILVQRDRAKNHPDEVGQVAAALREGWRAYLDDPKPTNAVMAKLNPDMDLATFDSAADAQKSLIETEETRKSGLGTMTLERWKQLIDQLLELGVIDKTKAPPPNRCFVGTSK